jgi:hypothetical protein
MKRAKQLGSVVFTRNTLFIKEEFEPSNWMEERVISADGTDIVYVAEHKTPNITLLSEQYGALDEAQRSAIIAMYNDVDNNVLLTYDDGSTDQVRIRRDTPPVFTPMFEGACTYTATISLARVL